MLVFFALGILVSLIILQFVWILRILVEGAYKLVVKLLVHLSAAVKF